MELVYTHENFFLVSNAQALLENAGIDATIKNEFTGGARGDIPAFETWPEVWVEGDDLIRAQEVLSVLKTPSSGGEWFCRKCQEQNFSNFTLCWNCQAMRPDAEG